ncbi:SusC/RagA family TonB-linked outer membrane protein [Pedobacter africanus]|uniref:TonB-linked SusC/RagA family outer membrane protein n=1 Tax=Pedobacter africanus TaxID=151894 RepID=A0ACC6KUE9_9SPHI|nr:SusC/RagA family TonB-linked outer membrane protein [Pedobacter africanus]MDR6782825.1 TonB-linked SusC/RagA family outer membrane protein [Pedobacter africanus]
MLQVSASTLAQKFTYVKKQVPLSQVFKEVKKQTGYNILWNERSMNANQLIDANFRKSSIQDVLNQCIGKLPLSFSIDGKMVFIKQKENEPSLVDKVMDLFKLIDVRGKVVDEKNEPLVGAIIKVKGGTASIATNSDGEFLLKNIEENTTLQISFMGYQPQEIKAIKNIGVIILKISVDRLQEVQINAGYYTVPDKERTGAISRITSKDIEKQPVNNILQAMQANIPGMQIVQTTGLPGGGFSIRIRGQNSISNGSEPFYIIDGVPFTSVGLGGSKDGIYSTRGANPLASINPNDIESIEILKDADATAIYGSRGANGVVLVTTKRGKIGKAKASFSINQGISKVGKKLDLMNTDEYLDMRKEAFANDKLTPSTTDYDINGTWDQSRYTDWQKELIGGTAPITNILASLSGGANNITFLVGANYYIEGTVFPGEHSYKRGAGNFSLQYTSDNKKLRASFDSNYSQINSNLFTTDLTQFIRLVPNYPTLLDEKGRLNWDYNESGVARMYMNPIAETQRPFNAKTNNLISNALVSYNIISDLKVQASMGYTKMDRREISMLPLTTFSPAFNYGSAQRQSFFTNNSLNSWITEAQANWSKQIGMGKLDMLVGTTFQQNITEGQEVQGSGYTSDALMGNIAAASILTVSARTYLQYRYTAIFGRVNYIFRDKYILNATARRDGSSRFGTDNRFANFGAIGAAWLVSNENCFKDNLPFVSFAKLRGSYGITGNDQIGDYAYISLWRPSGTYQGVSSVIPSQLRNPNLAWEVNKKLEIALELGFLKDKINLSIDHYRNHSSNQLLLTSLTPSTGFASFRDNLPAKVINTGWEFTLNTNNYSKGKFTWSTSINLTIPKNKLESYPGLTTSSQAGAYEIGYPLTIKKLYNTYVDGQSGLSVIEDYDKNGVIEFIKDARNIRFIGRDYYGGLQNSLSHNGIQLDFLFQFVKQSGLSSAHFLPAGMFFASSPVGNQTSDVADHWRNPGDNSRFQKYTTSFSAFSTHSNAVSSGSLAIEDASFIRLKNISISYNLPTKFIQKLKISNARFFLQGQNLLTITSYKGLDPETLSANNLPSLQVFSAGLQLTL